MSTSLGVKYNTKDLEICTYSVESALRPLVMQITTLAHLKTPKKKAKGKSKRAKVLLLTVQKATDCFIEKGEQIAEENPDVKEEMLAAVDEVKTAGKVMFTTAQDFCEDPCSSNKRTTMVDAAKKLLLSVLRLLTVADMVDVTLLFKSLNLAKEKLQQLGQSTTEAELMGNMKEFNKSAEDLLKRTAKRQQDVRDPQIRDELASARANLVKHSPMIFTSSKLQIQNPHLPAAKNNRDYVLDQVGGALDTIGKTAEGRGKEKQEDTPDGLERMLDKFQENVKLDPNDFGKVYTRISLEEQLDEIVNRSKLMADSEFVKDERREKILLGCDAVRKALQNLLSEYINTAENADPNKISDAVDNVDSKTKDLRRHLRKVAANQVSHSFLDTLSPLDGLVTAAYAGNQNGVEKCGTEFIEHSKRLKEVADLVCSVSNNEEGIKMVTHAAQELVNLSPGVVNAAKILSINPNSKAAQENLALFRQAWEQRVKILTDAVDEITTIDDFLSVSEGHILEDFNKCLDALRQGDVNTLERIANCIRARSNRMCEVVTAEMDNYEPCMYTNRVKKAIRVLQEHGEPKFDESVKNAVEALSNDPPQDVDENEMIDASRLVYEGLRDVRRAVLMNRTDDELDPEDVLVDISRAQKPATNTVNTIESNKVGLIDTLPENEKQQILKHVKHFHDEKRNFEREVAKWDDSGNDIVVLAKYMASIMIEMTDFTHGRGPLKSTSDFIAAAQRISEAGEKMDKLVKEILKECPESSTKQDLEAYLQRIALYCHQMKITSKVKADVQSISEKLVIANLDSATSLIQAAKNLMNAVVATVKASYVASTKYPSKKLVGSSVLVWKMKLPEKKPLVRVDNIQDFRGIVRRASQKKIQNPTNLLLEFESTDEQF